LIVVVPSGDEVNIGDKPPLSSLRERGEELIDALEKERLRLPKIGIETSNMIVSSPCDSGDLCEMNYRVFELNRAP
jgi:hypothetical protein